MNLRCILCQALAAVLALWFTTAHAASPRINLNLDENRTIEIAGPIDRRLSLQFVSEMQRLDDGKPITILISSPGGSIYDGIDMIKAMQNAKSPVTCVVDKYAASMAGFFAIACPKLLMHKYALLMFHEYSTSIQGPRKEIKSRLDQVESIFESLVDEMSRKSGIPREKLDVLVANDWWLNAREADEAKLVSGIVDHYNITKRRLDIDGWFRTLQRTFTPKGSR